MQRLHAAGRSRIDAHRAAPSVLLRVHERIVNRAKPFAADAGRVRAAECESRRAGFGPASRNALPPLPPLLRCCFAAAAATRRCGAGIAATASREFEIIVAAPAARRLWRVTSPPAR
ncbi:hypothetical protein [Burkholderia sp. MSMB1589WGS]|uniref:hypothetical protein n=1 Tax=Burkholderia sp. MSMB1589WGS TaxID=1636425 RepID=UPI0012E7D9FE|nr:hypothetical protein [Burkholderia sp. MSMB1589WGS]